MTRKCVICKETNYKNSNSFFSAPKDPETRKLWQDVIGIENYVVKDDTYVCSKHFYSTDIITHWFSGVPPHVITIKYKKFRLRPGAVPKIGIDPNDKDPQFLESDSECEVNRSVSPNSDPLSPAPDRTEEKFSIPREDINKIIKKEYVDEIILKETDLEDQDSRNCFENTVSEHSQKKKFQANYNPREENKSLMVPKLFVDNQNNRANENWETGSDLSDSEKERQVNIKSNTEIVQFIDDQLMDFDEQNTSSKISDSETMLFEDLLEIYTEVILPKGWSSLMMSKGQWTTIVYFFMNISKSGMPFLEKQVFVKSDMVLHCSVGNTEIDAFMHNLIKENRNLNVHTLMDVEDIISEFDKRRVCEGNPATKILRKHIKEAIWEGSNWRHSFCSLIINNGLSKCSKCAFLSSKGRKHGNTKNTSLNCKSQLVERINIFEESVKENTKFTICKDRLLSLSPKTISLLVDALDLLNLPKIQKIMIKECFKHNSQGDENVPLFSQTWIFLSLLLYIESPVVYKYILQNKYMNLPPILTITQYLKKIKNDQEFYNTFQRSIKPFQCFNEE